MTADTKSPSKAARRYAQALFSLVQESGREEQVCKDLSEFESLLQGNADIRNVLSNPLLKKPDQKRLFETLLAAAKASKLFHNFIMTLIDNRRLADFPDILRAFEQIFAEHQNKMTAYVSSVHDLSDEQATKLRHTLHQITGKDVDIVEDRDPSLLAGFCVKFGAYMIDTSLKTKLRNLHTQMKGFI